MTIRSLSRHGSNVQTDPLQNFPVNHEEIAQDCANAHNHMYDLTKQGLANGTAAAAMAADYLCTMQTWFDSRLIKACKKGCASCCYQPISAQPLEVFLVATALRGEYLERPEELAKIMARLERVDALAREHHTAESYVRAGIACPALQDEGTCGIYDFRPFVCRVHMSLDADECKKGMGDPHHSIPVDRTWNKIGVASALGMMRAMREFKRDITAYQFIPALVYAIKHPECEQRWINGFKAFPNCPRALKHKEPHHESG